MRLISLAPVLHVPSPTSDRNFDMKAKVESPFLKAKSRDGVLAVSNRVGQMSLNVIPVWASRPNHSHWALTARLPLQIASFSHCCPHRLSAINQQAAGQTGRSARGIHANEFMTLLRDSVHGWTVLPVNRSEPGLATSVFVDSQTSFCARNHEGTLYL